MKKSSVLMIAAALLLSSCGTFTRLASSSEGQKFQDGIYSNAPDLRSKEEKAESKAETDALIAKTKESPIYLSGDQKDTVSLGSPVVTVSENPYDWRNNLNPWSYYSPYTLRYSWHWSSRFLGRHMSPYYRMSAWTFRYTDPWYYSWNSPWFYGWNDPWLYGWNDPWFYGWNDPWFYGGYWGRWYDPFDYWGAWGWYSPWYYGGYWGGWYPHYAGWYGGFGPHFGYYPGHGYGPGLGHGGHFSSHTRYMPRHETQPDERVSSNNGRTTARRGTGTSSSVSRGTVGSGYSRSTTASKSEGSSVTRRTVTRQNTAVSAGSQAAGSKPAAETGKTTTYRRPAVSSGSGNASNSPSTTRSNGSGSESRGTISNSSSTTRSSANYERNNSSSYNRSSSTTTRSSGFSNGGGSGASGGGSTRSGGSGGGGARR